MTPCIFCNLDEKLHIASNDMFFAIADKHPRAKGHSLIISRRHAQDYFELSPVESASLHELILKIQKHLDDQHQPNGYNLIMNCGKAAGQTVFHFHLHLIPRYLKDRHNIFREVRKNQF